MSSKPHQVKDPAAPDEQDAAAALAARALGGDAQAFEEIVHVHETAVHRICLAITRNVEDAEDAMQETFISAYRNLGQFRGESRFATWLTRIAVNEALKRLRKHRNTESLDDLIGNDDDFLPRQLQDWRPNPEQLYSAEEMRRIVEKVIWSLPMPYRVVFVLRDLCGQSAAETGQVLKLSVPAVKTRLLRARLMVRESMAHRLKKSSALAIQIRQAAVALRGLAERFCRAMGF